MGVNDLEVQKDPEAQSQPPAEPSPEAEDLESGADVDIDFDVRGEDPAPQSKEAQESAPGSEAKKEEEAQEPVPYDRFSKVYGRMKHLERELEKRAQAEGPPPAEPQAQEQVFQADRPKEDDFDTYEAYIEALTDWKIEQKAAQRTSQVRLLEARKAFDRRLTEGAARMPEFEERAFIPRGLANVVIHSEMPADLAYYWGEHREEALELLDLAPEEQAYRIARLEEMLRSKSPPRRNEPKTKFPPVKTVDGVGEGTRKGIHEMSTEEYINYMNKKEGVAFRD